MTVREAAAQYIALGWQVVTLAPKSTRCIDADWLTRTYTSDDFGPDANIGIKSVGGLIDMRLPASSIQTG